MMRMIDLKCKATLKAAVAMSVCFLFAAVAAFGQQSVYLTAAPTTATMPDGSVVPMWGYFCGTPAAAIASGASSTAFTATTAFDGSLTLPVNGYIGKIVTAGVVSGAVTSNTPTTLTVAGWYPNAGTSYTLTLSAWAASTAYTAGQLIVDSNGNVQMVTTAGTSGTAAPAWGATAGATTADGTTGLVWTFQRSATSAAATTSYTLTSATDTTLNMPANAYVGATVTVGSITGIVASNTATTLTLGGAGWSGATPAANTAISAAASTAGCAALNPHSATPASVTPGAWVASHTYSVSSVILDSNGNVQMVTTTGQSGTAPPTWGTTAGATTHDGTGTLVWTFAGSLATYLSTATSWSPVVVTVPTGQALTINLTNNLSFTPAGATTANNVPTSIVIVGQVGGGLGAPPTTTPSPNHAFVQGCPTWFIASGSTPPGTPCTVAAGTPSGTNSSTVSTTPPNQGPRVQSMATEVAAGATTSLTWAALKPGTYLLESGTHPSIQVPMGLIGVLVVTTAPTATTSGSTTTLTPGTAYPATATSVAVPYNAELPLEFSEIDPVQNKEVDQAVRTVGFSETAVWTRMTALGALSGLTLTNPGTGYTSAPTITIGAPTGGSPAQASATATVGAVVSTITVTNGGSGYSAAPTVTITDSTGSNGSGATATATVTLGNGIGSIALTNAGAGYTAAPTVTITDSTGTGATATAALSATGTIASVTITAAGSGYTAPVVTIAPPTIPATATATLVSGGVGPITVTNPGAGYTAAPGVTISDSAGGTGSGATATATLSATGTVASIAVTAAGTGYTAPVVAIAPPPPGTPATATAHTAAGGVISAITVTNPGSFYTSPTVTITDPTGTGAAATANLAGSHGVIYALTLTNSGEGYTAAPTVSIAGGGGTGAAATAAILSGGCGGGVHTCYPPAVNYTPLYYLIDGVAFNKNAPTTSVFSATAGGATTGITGTVLLRLVNAGLRMHTPSIVNSLTQGFNGAGAAATVAGFTLIAEDGNLLPNVAPLGATTIPAAPRVQTDVLMVPSKVFDALVNVPAAGTTSTPALPIYARDLALSGNASVRDAGMLAYISVNNTTAAAALPVQPGTAGSIFAPAAANPDTYNVLVAGQPFTVSDPSKGVIANDVNVYGVTLLKPPTNGTVTCSALAQSTPTSGMCANGTFTWTPLATYVPPTTGPTDSFTYCANGTVSAAGVCSSNISTTVTLGPSGLTAGHPSAINQSYTASTATFIKIDSPGLLLGNTDPNGLPISVANSSLPACTNPITANCGNVDPMGGFTFALLTPATTAPIAATFTYTIQNSQGTQSAAPSASAGTVTVTFPVPSNLKVNVLDAQLYNNCNLDSTCIGKILPLTDYRWIIEEDETFWVDPNCTTNQSITTPGCPTVVGGAGTTGSTIPTYGVNFHTSSMRYIAQGCTGPLSCEGGQTMLDTRAACTTAPTATTPGVPAGCSTTAGQHIPAVCDLGNGACRPDPTGTVAGTGNGSTWVDPREVVLDPSKRYYISVLPGDAANPFPPTATTTGPYFGNPVCSSTGGNSTTGTCGHTMGGAPIPPACNVLLNSTTSTVCGPATGQAFAAVNVLVLPTPLPTGKLSVIVFEDDWPLNGEQDGGGGNGTVAPIEPGLGGFNIVLWDTFGGLGDVTGQNTYDDFNQPLSNGLAGTIDPTTGVDACPVSLTALQGPGGAGPAPASGMTGMIVTCPKYEADNVTLSPLAGQAVVYNLMPEKFSVQAYPGADRIARGEQWVQTNTLDGQHPHDSFIRIGEPGYFQEYGPAGYHVAIGFANPAIINARHDDVCNGNGTPGTVGPCTNTITGQVDVQRLSRTPDQRLYASGSRAALAWTQCWVSLGDPDGEDFMFTFCDANGNFQFKTVPGGNWRLTIGDQWNDQIIDGLSIPANVGCTNPTPNGATNSTTCPGGATLPLGNIGVQQWQSNVYTHVFIDDNKNGIPDPGEIGIPFLYTRIYYRDGHNSNGLSTDFNGIANFNETFPLFNWYVVEADSTRYKRTGIHTVYDAGGPADGTCATGTRPCGASTSYTNLSNTYESVPLPADLSVPGAVYCANADCGAEAAAFATGTSGSTHQLNSTGRIDPPWVTSEGWSGLTSHSNWIDFGFAPYAANENGGIHGQVTYASTRPFDDADQMILQPWEPLVPGVTINLYQEGFAADGVTPTLTLVDQTVTSSWDAWAQGFYPGSTANGGGLKPYMSCPGQGTAATSSPNQDLFFYTLFDQPNFLDWYTSLHSDGATPVHPLPYNSQYKCYDAMHIGNQLQPAPYDGEFFFPSSLGINPTTGKPLTTQPTAATSPIGKAASMPGTYCSVCVANPDTTDAYRVGTPMLPAGKYVAEVVMPPGYEVYKEEDKNLLIGDNFIAPVTQQFGGLGAYIFIIPDQASVASLYDQTASGYNPSNFQDQTTALGLGDELSGVPGYPGFQDPVWPCVGEMRTVPDFLSLFPRAQEVAPFAGATRPLCDRKEVTLANQMNVRMHFAIYTSTHIASKYTGGITDDFTSEFDPFSPQFGEKFAPPNMPVSTRDYLGNEISRVYSDHWGTYDGLTFSSWEVNPPNITGYSPTIMVQCMNDPGPIVDNRTGSATFGQLITDPLYNPAYSDFCYEQPFMPGLTNYTDTPVVPTQAFVGAGYNNVDCAYPEATPAIAEVDGSGIGPWVISESVNLTIKALGNQQVNNSAYSGPSANTAPFNAKTVGRHYGFGSRCTAPIASSATCNTLSSVTIGGVPAPIVNWSDTQIQATVPTGVPNCLIQQQGQYSGATAQCGQLVITAGNGKQSVDTVTVTIGGKMPTHVSANQSVQSAIDAAAPGDLIIVDPTCMTVATTTTPSASATCSSTALDAATPTQTAAVAAHSEMLIMWKPVRLQGVGAASSVISANANPAGKLLDPWRRHINCLFGLTLQGVPYTGNGPASTTNTQPYDPNFNGTAGSGYTCPDTGWANFTAQPNVPQIDRLPLEATIGWDATLNGNLAEQLQEPSLMGAFEGAGITVLGKSLEFHGVAPWTDGNEGGAFPTVTTLLTGVVSNPGGTPGTAGALPVGDDNPFCHTGTYDATTGAFTVTGEANPYPSNFMCNPSSIDGLTITNSSQGGGGIFAHGWAHFLQIANNRVYNNAGTLTGGISVGQGEFPTPYVLGGAANAAPGSCSDGTGLITNQHLPYCLQLAVNVHNNYITSNSSLGDELFSGTLSGGGGATFCTGNDYYKFNFNWVCGNLSAGEGGGIVHLGEIQNGDIERNSIVLNQSQNPTIPTNGGGIHVQGTPDTDPVCGILIDADCPPGLSDGTGHNLVINANLIQGNMAESGAGGGIRLQQVNGTDVSTFPGVYPITAATEAPVVTITAQRGAVIPAVGQSVTIAGVTCPPAATNPCAPYNGTFTVTGVGRTGGTRPRPTFQYTPTTPGLPAGTGGTFTYTATGATTPTTETIFSTNDTAVGEITITSTLSPTPGDTVTIRGVSVAGYNITCIVTAVPSVGTFTCSDPNTNLAAGTGGTVTDVAAAGNPSQLVSSLWNGVSITNNMIVNNVAGWDGAGISLQDALNAAIINNTIASNDTLASSGVLTQSIGTPDSSAPAGSCVQAGLTTSCPQSAGVTSTLNSSALTTTFTGLTIMCPTGQPNCASFSNPLLVGNLIWQNRSFHIGVGSLGAGTLNQQNVISLFTAGGAAAPVQTAYGQCSTGVSYWDIGVRGDTGPGNHSSGFALSPLYSVLDDTGYGSTNSAANPRIASQYCNGSRVPPTCTVADGCGGPSGYGVPPGIVDATAPNPVFSLTPAATVDEGNNWVNVSFGPLSLSDDSVAGGANGNYGGGALFANYALAVGSPAIDHIPCSNTGAAQCNVTVAPGVTVTLPTTDFFGNHRPDAASGSANCSNSPGHACVDVGAVEAQGNGVPGAALLQVTPTSLSFPNTGVGSTSAAQTLTLANTGTAAATGISEALTAPFSRPGGGAGGTCGGTLAAGATCTINIVFGPTSATAFTGTATINASVAVTGSPVALSGTGVAAVRTASVSPTSLAFGTVTAGTTSAARTITVTNTGNVTLTGGAVTFGGGTPQPFSRATGAAAGTCTATLAVGASCTYGVVFHSPTGTVTTFNRTVTASYTGATVTGSPVTLSGTN